MVNFRQPADAPHKETTTMKKKGGKAKKGKTKDLSVRKGGSVKGGMSAARMKA